MVTSWEDAALPSRSSTLRGQQSHPQALPSLHDLAQGVPASGRPDDPGYYRNDPGRDSGNWSMPSQSKHSSTASFATNGIHLPALNSNRTSPGDRFSAVSLERSPQSATYHSSSPSAPDEPHSHLAQLNQSFEPHTNGSQRESTDFTSAPLARPSSVTSRMNHLALTSPLASTNASQTSLVSGLQRERGIPMESNGNNGFRYSSASNNVTTTSLGRRVGRTAPPINIDGASQWQNPNAEMPTKGLPWAFPDPDESAPNPHSMKPTKGQPWAFPDPELAARPSSKSDHDMHSHPPSMRRESIGSASVTSSLYTTDSRLPVGQRRFEEEISSPIDQSRPVSFSRDVTSTELPGANHHHHHQLQHRQLTSLSNDQASTTGGSPYSRTPELRISHKMAERKRRCEMKTLFEELRLILPADGRVSKQSKWEILTKAIDHIRGLEQGQNSSERRGEMYRESERLMALQRENQELRDEIQKIRQQTQQTMPVPNGNHHYHHPHPTGPHSSAMPRPTLPIPGSSTAMQGVQYSA
ncbi:MAG: hypothetical protein M1816_001145 [Peltula sp. TS41687]|nr:MAG: hypothetical protein M1816_001145 [Peltula sp. TS41687]